MSVEQADLMISLLKSIATLITIGLVFSLVGWLFPRGKL